MAKLSGVVKCKFCSGPECSILSQQNRWVFTWHTSFSLQLKNATSFSPSPIALVPNRFSCNEGGTGLIIIMDHSGVLESGQDAEIYELVRPAGWHRKVFDPNKN